eukprot:gene3315-3243_t
MKLIALPAFSDNYIWLLHDDHHALVVDPGESAPVRQWLQQHPHVQLDLILVTHHHADHTGGVADLVMDTQARVLTPAMEPIPLPSTSVKEGDLVNWHGLNLKVLDVPGHTAGHGTPAQMLDSLDRLAALPGNTRVCCAHEYTLSNLKFALAVDPGNTALQAYAKACHALRDQGLPTLPVALSNEQAINPFLRSRSPSVAAAVKNRDAKALDDIATFAALRAWKNEFR